MLEPRVEIVDSVPAEDLVDLYASVGWTIYTADPELLERAVARSTYVAVVRDADRLVALVRGMSDDASILYIQDLLVRPECQGHGLGRLLLASIVERFGHVRQKVLLTDDEIRQHNLYRSLGFSDVDEQSTLHAFFRIDG